MLVSVPTAELLRLVTEQVDPAVEVVEWPMDGPPPRPSIDIVVPPYMGKLEPLKRVAEVTTRLVQSQSIGYNGVEQVLPAGTTFANATSVHEASTAELAVGLAIAAQRALPVYATNQLTGTWHPIPAESLADRHVLIVGFGGVGEAVLVRLAPFEVTITCVASRARTTNGQQVHGIDELDALLPEADIVILTVPLTEATTGMVDDHFLTAMKRGALLINVARGAVVDTAALVDHVRRGRIRAALDVTDPEPLPPDHELWTLPGVLITPHVGGASSAMIPRMVKLIVRQTERMLAGEEPLNVVLRT
ncbi:2-hydroxyacid dehydrogenase [soil metagenome]